MLSLSVSPTFLILVVCVFSRLFEVNCDTVSSPHIRILDVATKSSETRLIPHRIEYENEFHPKYQQQSNWYEQNRRPLKSYVIYDDYPVKIFKEWKGDADFSVSRPSFLLELNRHPEAELTPDYYLRNRPHVLPQPKPTLAYHSVYSNIIKVFDDSLEDFGPNRFQGDRLPKPYDGGVWKLFQPPVQYEPIYPQEIPREPYQDEKLPDNFPKIFSPNTNFHFTPYNEEEPKPPKHFYPQRGYYDTHTVNYNEGGKRHSEDVEFLPEIDTNPKNQKVFLCSFIKLNQKQFPESGQPCSRSEDNLPILAPEYPDYSKLPNDKIPVEHRRQHHQMKRIKRSEDKHSGKNRQKRASGLGYSYGAWGTPFGYENSYDGYLSDYYPSRGGYGSFGSNYGSSNYYRNNGSRDRYQGYRNRYYSGSRSNYDDYDDEYQSNDDSKSKGLTSYLTSGGRRYKNRKNNDDDDNDEEDNDNYHDEDSDEEMERQNSGRRGSNDRRNNDESKDRRRNNNNSNSNSNNNNNNNNDEDDTRDNRRNNNRQNGNSRRNNKRYNDRYDYNNRNRNSYGSNSGYGLSNGYGSSNGGYGSSYGSGYGSNNGYGTSGGYGNNGYGNSYGSYGSHGGFGYGSGYGNGFSSI